MSKNREENREFQSQRQREAWLEQGLDVQSQQQLRSNSDLALQLMLPVFICKVPLWSTGF